MRSKARKDSGEILRSDQVGVRSDQVTGRTWVERCKTPVVRRSGYRFAVTRCRQSVPRAGCPSWSSLSASPPRWCAASWTDWPGYFDRKIRLVVDGHSAHLFKQVRDWLSVHPDDIELHFCRHAHPG